MVLKNKLPQNQTLPPSNNKALKKNLNRCETGSKEELQTELRKQIRKLKKLMLKLHKLTEAGRMLLSKP